MKIGVRPLSKIEIEKLKVFWNHQMIGGICGTVEEGREEDMI